VHRCRIPRALERVGAGYRLLLAPARSVRDRFDLAATPSVSHVFEPGRGLPPGKSAIFSLAEAGGNSGKVKSALHGRGRVPLAENEKLLTEANTQLTINMMLRGASDYNKIRSSASVL